MTLDSEVPAGPADAIGHDVVVVGASAGGVEALRTLVAALPPDLPAAVLVVLHIPRGAPSALPAILDRAGPLPARRVIDGERLVYGRVYVAPADHHLLLVDGRIRLSRGPTENGHRPAVDPLFRSAARAYGPRVVGVVLSGSRDDGAAGAAAVAGQGGVVVVQDPAEALHPSMPEAVMRHTTVDHVLPAAKIGPLLAELSGRTVTATDPVDDGLLNAEVEMAETMPVTTDQLGAPPSGFACPSCGGALFEIEKRPLPRFRCRVGHAWSPESLLAEQGEAVERALWVALRALEEKAALGSRLYRAWAEEADQAGGLIRNLIGRLGDAGDGPEPG
jgi:two-component system, chemotaxis family, protein-glutamate methylesterase/glutaminase